MPQERDLPKKYDIPPERYRELKYFCLQYPKKKERAGDTYGLSAAAPSGMPSASGCSEPTARQAERQWQDKEDVALIEQCIDLACGASVGMAAPLLKSVAYGVPYEYMPVPCGRRQFYHLRHEFFCILDARKK